MYLSRQVALVRSISSYKQTFFLGLSSSLTGGVAYSYIVSLGYFTPAVGIIAGLAGGFGAAAKDILYGKENYDDIPLKTIAAHVLFGIIALFLGYIFVYHFVKLPDIHGEFTRPVEQGRTIFDFFKETMGLPDILGAIFGSISSCAIPVNLTKIKKVLKLRN